jgi:5-methylcytosine-specific restriction endonuclease McrA
VVGGGASLAICATSEDFSPTRKSCSDAQPRTPFTHKSSEDPHFLAAHHVIPRAEGGADDPANLIALCASCHARLEPKRR